MFLIVGNALCYTQQWPPFYFLFVDNGMFSAVRSLGFLRILRITAVYRDM
jgi:hypothetical protein